ncbi:MAG: RNA polymerase sigma factor [Acidimicrobiales bacterium]|nr:RNA polymerase sigma factor [Acidimicrobiales bacterium]HRW39699.1 RNA polymerase sigma factor [Aquihabitans sp.]
MASDPDPDLDERRFRALFADHFDRVWRFSRRRCESAADADEVAAETFAIAWRRRRELPSDDELHLWLYGVARRVVANQRRGAGRRERLLLRLHDAAATAPAAILAPDEHGPDRDRLAVALGRLDDDDRELLVLRAWDGLPVHEIAVLLGCTPNAASIRLHRARRRLASLLDPEVKDPVASRTSNGRPTGWEEDTP